MSTCAECRRRRQSSVTVDMCLLKAREQNTRFGSGKKALMLTRIDAVRLAATSALTHAADDQQPFRTQRNQYAHNVRGKEDPSN
eukprot:3615765-Pleurochrysis_carterae.AAC.1